MPTTSGPPATAFAVMMRTALAASAGVMILAAAGCYLWRGGAVALAALAGVVVTAAFLAGGLVALRAVLAGPSGASLAGALLVYSLQLTGLFVLVVLGKILDVLPPEGVAVGALSEVAVWQIAQIYGLVRSRQYVFDRSDDPPGGQ